jgi:hypothetical protein
MKTLIIGAGEVGKALKQVIEKHHETYLKDLEPLELGGVQVLHICYPEHDGFVKTTQSYIDHYKPNLTIINSSISVGTSNNFDDKVVYSPIRGRHNRFDAFGKRVQGLEFDIPCYTKFVFGNLPSRKMAEIYFKECGMDCYSYSCDNRSDGEVLKLLSNIHMGVEIAWRQEVERILKHYGVSSNLYENWERTYNQGYQKCGDGHLIRPLMKPDPIGGHCILPCTKILSKQFPSKIFDFVMESNEKAKQNKI